MEIKPNQFWYLPKHDSVIFLYDTREGLRNLAIDSEEGIWVGTVKGYEGTEAYLKKSGAILLTTIPDVLRVLLEIQER